MPACPAAARLVTFVALVASTTSVRADDGFVTERIRRAVTEAARTHASATVTFRSIEIEKLRRLTLVGLEASRDFPAEGYHVAVSVDRVSVDYAVVDFLLGRKKAIEGLERASLVRPRIAITRRAPGTAVPPKAATAPGALPTRAVAPVEAATLAALLSRTLAREKLPPVLLELQDGQIRYTDRTSGFVAGVDQVSGRLDLARPNPAVDLRARLNGRSDQHLGLSGTYEPKGPHFRTTLTLSGLDLSAFSPLVGDGRGIALVGGKVQMMLALSDGDLSSTDLRRAVRARGNLIVRGGEVAFPAIGKRLDRIEARLELTDRDLTIRSLQARWGTTRVLVTRGTLRDLPVGAVDLEVRTDGLDLAELAAVAPSLAALGLSGAASTTWTVSGALPDPRLRAVVVLPAGRIGAIEIRDAIILAGLDRSGLRLERLHASAFGGEFSGSGRVSFPSARNGALPSLDPSGIRLDLEFDVAEVAMRELTALAGFADLSGRADLSLRVTGTAADPSVAGELSARRIFVRGEKMESLTGRFQIGPASARFEAETSDRTFTAAGTIPRADRSVPLAITLQVTRYPLASLAYLARAPLGSHRISGLATGRIVLEGTSDVPVLRGALGVEAVTFDRYAMPSLATKFRYEHDRSTNRNDVILEQFELDQGDGRTLSAEGSLNFGAGERVVFAIRCHRIDLGRLPVVEVLGLAGVDAPPGVVNGHLSGRLDVAGSLAAPRVRAAISIEGYEVSGIRLREARGEVAWDPGRLELKDFTIRQDPSGLFHAHGSLDLASRSFAASIAATDVDLANFPPLAAAAPGLSGRVHLEAAASGTIADPTVRVKLWTKQLEYARLLRVDAEGQATLTRRSASLDALAVNLVPLALPGRPSYAISAKGRIPLEKDPPRGGADPLDIEVILSSAELHFLTLVPGIQRAGGTADGRLRLRGRFDEPRWDGELVLRDALVEPPGFVRTIRRMNGRLVFEHDSRSRRNVARLERSEVQFDHGRLFVEGHASLDERFRPADFRFFVWIPTASDAIAAELPGIARLERVHGTFVVSGDPTHVVLSTRPDPARDGVTGPIALHLSRGRVTFPPLPSGDGETSGGGPDLSFLDFRDFTLRAEHEVVYYNEFGNVSVGSLIPATKRVQRMKLVSSAKTEVVVKGDLTFQGRLDELVLSGLIRAERGTFTVLDTDFRVRSGQLRFDPVESRSGRSRTTLEEAIGGESLGKLKFVMKLDAEGVTHASDVGFGSRKLSAVKVLAEVTGQIANAEAPLRILLSSDPAFTQNQIISLLLFGSVLGIEPEAGGGLAAVGGAEVGGAASSGSGGTSASSGLVFAASKLGQAAIHSAVNSWLLANFERSVKRATGFDLLVKTSVLENLWRNGSDPSLSGSNRSAIWSGTGIEMRRYLSDDLFVSTKFNMVSPLAMISGIPGSQPSSVADQSLLPNFELGLEYRTELPVIGAFVLSTHENLFEWFAGWSKTIQF